MPAIAKGERRVEEIQQVQELVQGAMRAAASGSVGW